MNSITLTVKGISIKSEGTNANGPWHLYSVEDTNGKKHSTFLEGLVIGETYDFLQEIKPYVSKNDGKTYQGSNLTGFDNVAYEQKKERPAQSTPAAAPVQNGGFTAEDRRKLDAIYDTIVGSNPL